MNKNLLVLLMVLVMSGIMTFSVTQHQKALPAVSQGDCFNTGKQWTDVATGEANPQFSKYYMQVTEVRETSFGFVLKPYNKSDKEPDGEMSALRNTINPQLKIKCPQG